jgi:PilZ domain
MSGDSLELVNPWPGLSDSNGFVVPGIGERRRRARTRLHWPVLMQREHHQSQIIESTTRDLSSGGFYCLTRVHLVEGEQLHCSMKIPTHDPRGKNPERTLECTVRVLRVVPQDSSDVFGIACRIEDYHLGQVQADCG